jgi:hypothetical protein
MQNGHLLSVFFQPPMPIISRMSNPPHIRLMLSFHLILAFSVLGTAQEVRHLRLGVGIGNTAEGVVPSNTPTVRYLERALPGYQFE